MLSRDWKLPTNLQICFYADSFQRTAQDTVFSQLNDFTTPEQFEAVLSSLMLMKQELEKLMPPFHFAAQYGTHICLEEVFLEAANRLKFLAQLQAVPPVEPERERLTSEEIVNNLENSLQSSTEDTYLGSDNDPANNGSNK
jgi:hypothetical protein